MQRHRYTVEADIQEKIEELALFEGLGATQIHNRLTSDSGFEERVPLLRTVQRAVADLKPPDPSPPWSITDFDAEEANLVLEALAAHINRSSPGEIQTSLAGPVHSFSRADATWIVRVRKIAPHLDHWRTFMLASFYQRREAESAPTHDLDAYLASCASPEGQNDFQEYLKWVAEGRVRQVPMLSRMISGENWLPPKSPAALEEDDDE